MLTTTIFASGVLNGSMVEDDKIIYEVYNGDTKLSLVNEPFIYDGEYYLPLREVLNGFGITDIEYVNGEITIQLPKSELEGSATMCIIKIGDIDIYYGEPKGFRVVMGAAPILKGDETYVSTRFFEALITNGSIVNFCLNVIRPTEPENYYTKGEDVFIGTAKEQDTYTNENIGKTVKRIIVDENGEVIAVIPVSNQIPENIDGKFHKTDTAGGYSGYYHLFYESARSVRDKNNHSVYSTDLAIIESDGKDIAYIAPADIIRIPRNRYNQDLQFIVTNTYNSNNTIAKPISDSHAREQNPNWINETEACYNLIRQMESDFDKNGYIVKENYFTDNCEEQNWSGIGTVHSIYLYTDGDYRVTFRAKPDIGDEKQIITATMKKQANGKYLIDSYYRTLIPINRGTFINAETGAPYPSDTIFDGLL